MRSTSSEASLRLCNAEDVTRIGGGRAAGIKCQPEMFGARAFSSKWCPQLNLIGNLTAVPQRLADVIHQALATDPRDRFASAADLRTALLPFSSAAGHQRRR